MEFRPPLLNSGRKISARVLPQVFTQSQAEKTASMSLPHPFSYLTKKYGEIVTHKGNVYIPWMLFTPHQLQSAGVKRNFTILGPVSSLMAVPDFQHITPTARNIGDQACHYYTNYQKLETDLIRFTNSGFRKQYFSDFFSRDLYFKGNEMYEPSSLNSNTIAVFSSKANVVAFEKKANTDKNLADVMSTLPEPNISRTCSGITPCPTNRIIFYNVVSNDSIDTATFNFLIPSHSILAKGKKFNFCGTSLESVCYFTKNALHLQDYPRVATPNYKHFFVHADGTICYDGEERFADIGLRRGKWYSLDDKLIGYKLARVFEQGLLNLTQGYTPNCRPVNQPEMLGELAS